jgi:small subunit ribosomal protein S3
MGQKVNPIGFRLPISRDWSSRWYASRKDFADYLFADGQIREFLKKKLKQAAVARIVIERAWNSLRVTIHTARPGVVIGRKGSEIEKMTDEISRLAGGKQVKIDIVEIKSPDIDAQLVAENVASQLERRISFRRAMKRAVQIAMEQGALGIKIRCSGRLGGAEIARTEWYREGKVPLHTMRVPIDYGFTEAMTIAGKIGIKCWICKKPEAPQTEEQKNEQSQQQPRGRDRDRDRGNNPRNEAPAAPANA